VSETRRTNHVLKQNRLLTPKQAMFVLEYIVDLNATRAATAAGYSRKGAEVTGSQLLRNPKVGAEIERRITERAGRLEINADRVLKELARLAFLDPRKFFNDDGSPKQINDLEEDTARALAGMEVMELFEGSGEQKHVYGLIRKYKLADKRGSLELLGKHLKLFTDKVEHSGGIILKHSVARPKHG
jgi:phage terminase small subunit